ncbi:hypothetical protein H9L39_01219 [Fusarium oxysporum f. sp. albedinis]|nr:hypothetical protein H9L39_01219 [Fusarium oxysporum f. sp. albedinis]
MQPVPRSVLSTSLSNAYRASDFCRNSASRSGHSGFRSPLTLDLLSSNRSDHACARMPGFPGGIYSCLVLK